MFVFRFFFRLFPILDSSETPSQLEKDAGFCSGGSEIGDDYQSDRIQNSPNSTTDTSDDSVDVKLSSIVIPTNKRKSFESIKCENDVPLKKRYKFESHFKHLTEIESNNRTQSNEVEIQQQNVLRTWIPTKYPESYLPSEAEVLVRHPGVTTLHRIPSEECIEKQTQQDQPLALIVKKSTECKKSNAETNQTEKKPKPAKSAKVPATEIDNDFDEIISSKKSSTNSESGTNEKSNSRPTPQRNYKNMTRERRIEANARERTRVHTISAAFDTLRQAIPSYSSTQKLSKLSVLRVACSYILTLSRMAGDDYSADKSEPSIASCLDEITKTIQTEGKARKRKDE